MAGELPADVLEDMMIAEVVGNEVQDRNMPGAMPILFPDFADEENEVGGTEAPPRADAPAQALNAPVDAEGNSDEEEEDSEEEQLAVSPFRAIYCCITDVLAHAIAHNQEYHESFLGR